MRGIPQFLNHPRSFRDAFTQGQYRAVVTNVVDGDTIDILLDLGLEVYHSRRVRIASINTPELNSPDPAVRAAALAAKNRVLDLLTVQYILVTTFVADDKYGRYVTSVAYYRPDTHDFANLGLQLIAEGLAVYKEY